MIVKQKDTAAEQDLKGTVLTAVSFFVETDLMSRLFYLSA